MSIVAEDPPWRKSTRCATSDCVEISHRSNGGRVLVRNSQAPEGPHLSFATESFRSFVSAIRTGEFDR